MSESIVARGKIKVDARKAIAKLRDHLLVDLHLYSTEIARVAVAMGATTLDVEWDSDDVVISFDGRALPADGVSRARDHVLTPESDIADGDALRVLGIGISAALGLGPSFVDVYCADGSGCARVRFEPKHLDEEELAASPPPAPVQRPARMAASGMRVHVRRRAGLDVLSRALRRDLPREVALILLGLRDSALAVRVNGVARDLRSGPTVLVRVDLDEPSVTRACLELLGPARDVGPRTHFLELGVHLAESTGIGRGAIEDGQLPVRVIIDGKSLPTNASRSEVRMHADVIARIRARVPAALDAALVALADVTQGRPSKPSGQTIEVLAAPRDVQVDALGTIAASVAVARRGGAQVSDAEASLLDLPLLVNAVGAPMSLSALRGGTPERPLLVYTGKGPAPQDLASWLSGVIWQRGYPAERAFAALPQTSANERVALAREGATRRARALEHPPSRPELPASSAYVLKEAFKVQSGPFEGLEGEVAIVRREGNYRRSSTVRFFVDERLLQTMQLPGVALPVDIALAWPRGIRPLLAYDGVEQDERVSKAIIYALRVAALAGAERLAVADAELARLAIMAYASATQSLGDAAPARLGLGKLADHRIWPTTDGALVSLGTFDAYANRTGALCTGPQGSGAAIDGRPVVVAEHGKSVLAMLREKTRLVDYSLPLVQPASAGTDALAGLAAACLLRVAFARRNLEGFIGVGPNRKRVFHTGILLRDEAFAYRNGPVLFAVEDRAAVPAGTELLWSSPEIGDTAREEDALLELVVSACERGEVELVAVHDYLQGAARKVEGRLGSKRKNDDVAWTEAMVERLRQLPAKVERARLARARDALLARPALALPAGGASVTMRDGTVTAASSSDADALPPAEIRFQGRLLESRSLLDVPFAFIVDLAREDYVKDWATLSQPGLRWAREQAAEAALKLVAELAKNEAFTSDVAMMRRCELLLERGGMITARLTLLLRTARWPTVQGTLTTLPADGALPFGTEAYAPYRRAKEPSPYDAAAVHLPRGPLGDARRRLLTAASFSLQDVTSAVARLQELRARGEQSTSPPPRLPGAPAHPKLRESLAKLGATRAEGELELAAGPSSVLRVDERGTTQPVTIGADLPVHAIFRAAEASDEELATELVAATIRLLRSLGGLLDALPSFVRDRLRVVVCHAASRGQLAPGDDELRVFLDLDGRPWSLAGLTRRSALGPVERTRDAGAFLAPRADPGALVLRLSDAEAAAISREVATQDVTEALRLAERGHARRSAPALETIALSDALRASCMFHFVHEEDGLRGEIGLLSAAHRELRGLALHTTKRLLTTAEDGGSWPTVAALDIDGLATTPAFDGLQDRADLGRIQRRVRAAIATRSVEVLPAPPEAVAVVRTPLPLMARRNEGDHTEPAVPCIGIFWLTPQWPEAPAVHVEGLDFVDPFRVLRIAQTPGASHRVLPVAGRVWICATQARAEASLEVLARFVLGRLTPLLLASTRAVRAMAAEERAAYTWDLRLLGALSDVSPAAALAADRPDPMLMRVAARRAPHLIDAATGDKPVAPSTRFVTAGALPAPTPSSSSSSPAPATPGAQPADDAPPPSELDTPVGESFLRGLVRRVVELVTPAPEQVSESALTQSLHNALRAMKLTGDPVELVVEAARGRPVRYEAKRKRVLVNTTHESVRALEAHPARVLFLLAAAVSEINRELVPVTDAEERAVIIDLLRDGTPLSP